MEHYVVLPDGTQVPALGQGTWPLRFVTEERLQFPEAGKRNIPLDNAGADRIVLSQEEQGWIDQEFPAPLHKVYLNIV